MKTRLSRLRWTPQPSPEGPAFILSFEARFRLHISSVLGLFVSLSCLKWRRVVLSFIYIYFSLRQDCVFWRVWKDTHKKNNCNRTETWFEQTQKEYYNSFKMQLTFCLDSYSFEQFEKKSLGIHYHNHV